MAGGQPRGCRRQIYERLSPRQVRRGSKHRGRAAMRAPGGSPRTVPGTPIPCTAAPHFPRRPTLSPPRCSYSYYHSAPRVVSQLLHTLFPPFPSFASRFIFQPVKSPAHTVEASAAPAAGSRRRPSLPAGSPLPRAGKCRKSSSSPPAPSPGLDRSRHSPATGCKTHQPFRSCIGDGITTIMMY